ncbi:hypothetical protein D3C74_462450 [compost metagenome]
MLQIRFDIQFKIESAWKPQLLNFQVMTNVLQLFIQTNDTFACAQTESKIIGQMTSHLLHQLVFLQGSQTMNNIE